MFKFETKVEQNAAKEIYKKTGQSGVYRYFDPKTGKLKEEGRFQNGEEVGIWKSIDDNGDQRYFEITKKRIGAICRDGTSSQNVGHGACSRHGGVAQWIYQNVYTQVGGTGKYLLPIKQRVQQLKKKAKSLLKIENQGLEFQQTVLKLVINLYQENSELKQKESVLTKMEWNELLQRLETPVKEENNYDEDIKTSKKNDLASTVKVIKQKTIEQRGLSKNKGNSASKKLQLATKQQANESFLSEDLGSDSDEDESLIDPQKEKMQKGENYEEDNQIKGLLKGLKLN